MGYSPFQVLVSLKDAGPGGASVEEESSYPETGAFSQGESDGAAETGESGHEERVAPANAPAEDSTDGVGEGWCRARCVRRILLRGGVSAAGRMKAKEGWMIWSARKWW